MKKNKNQVIEENGIQKKKKRKKAPIIIVAIIVILFVLIRIAGCALASNVTAVVGTTTATRGDIQESISTSGTVVSEEQKQFFSQISGKLAEVKVVPGDAVKSGDVLITYDMKAAEDALQQATLQQTKSEASYNGIMADNSKSQAKLNEANTNLGVLKQQLEDHNAYLDTLQEQLDKHQRENSNAIASQSLTLSGRSAELEQQMSLLDPKNPEHLPMLQDLQSQLQQVSADMAYNQYLQQTAGSSDYVVDMQKKIADVQENIAKMEKYKAEMESQKAASENTVLDAYDKQQFSVDKELAALNFQTAEEDYNLAKQGVVAEFDGIVMECSAVQGATVAEGMQLMTLANSKQVKVSFSASKQDVEKLAVGQKVDVTVSGKVYEGEVSKINRMATVNASNTPMVGVEVHIANPDDKIILGMDAKLNIYTNKAENALLIPVEAINADKEGDFLYVVENGIVVRKPIVCGISSDTHTEVLEGITEEDQIIITAYTNFEEGMAVTIMPDMQGVNIE